MEASRFETLRSVIARSNISHARLAELECFRGLDADFMEELTRELDIELFSEGDIIMKEGAVGANMLFLVHGSVDVLQGDQKIACLGAGCVIGEMACMGLKSKRVCTVVATEFCDCRSIGARSLKALLNRFPHAREHFVFPERIEQMERASKAEEKQARLEKRSRSAIRKDAMTECKIITSPACSPPAKPGSAFRKRHLQHCDLETRSMSSVDTALPSSRACSADSCSTYESASSSDAPVDRDPIFIASPLRSKKAILPNISPASRYASAPGNCPQTLKDAMRAKNDLLRVQLQKAREDLGSACTPTLANQIDDSRLCRCGTF